MANTKGYPGFDIDIEKILTESSALDDYFFLQDLKQRKLYINSEIDDQVACEFVHHVLQFNADDKNIPPEERKPILLYMTSIGGDVDAGFEIIDVIKNSKTPVYTINFGYQYSMGFLIGLAGHKRFASPNAKFLMHDGSNMIYNSGAKAQDQMEFQRRVEERVKRYIIDHSHLTSEEYDSKLRVEWYLFADEAKEKGFVDFIIGQDCDIDAVI